MNDAEGPTARDRFEHDVRALLAAERLDPSYLAFVLQHLRAPDASWRWCCGSNCDPCVDRLGRVVDAARRLADPAVGGDPPPASAPACAPRPRC